MSNKLHRSMSVDCNLPHHFSPPRAPKKKKNFMDEADHLLWWHSLDGEEQKKWLITFISHSKMINTNTYTSQSTHTQEEKITKMSRQNNNTMLDISQEEKNTKKNRQQRNTILDINQLDNDRVSTPTPRYDTYFPDKLETSFLNSVKEERNKKKTFYDNYMKPINKN